MFIEWQFFDRSPTSLVFVSGLLSLSKSNHSLIKTDFKQLDYWITYLL